MICNRLKCLYPCRFSLHRVCSFFFQTVDRLANDYDPMRRDSTPAMGSPSRDDKAKDADYKPEDDRDDDDDDDDEDDSQSEHDQKANELIESHSTRS